MHVYTIAHWHNIYALITNSIQGKSAQAIMHECQNLQRADNIPPNKLTMLSEGIQPQVCTQLQCDVFFSPAYET